MIGRPRRGIGYALALASLMGLCAPLGAQTRVSVLPLQGLRFGKLVPGVAAVISPRDAARAASFDLVGSGVVILRVSVPHSLESDGRSVLPLRFGPMDGRVVFPGLKQDLVFDPAEPVSFSIPPGAGGVKVYLGASVVPEREQVPGAYDAAIEVELVMAAVDS